MLTLIMTILGGVAIAGLFAGATFLIAAAMGRMNESSESATRAAIEDKPNPNATSAKRTS